MFSGEHFSEEPPCGAKACRNGTSRFKAGFSQNGIQETAAGLELLSQAACVQAFTFEGAYELDAERGLR